MAALRFFVEGKKKKIAETVWSLSNLLKATDDVEKLVDEMSKKWDLVIGRKERDLRSKIALARNRDIQVADEVLAEYEEQKKRTADAKDMITEELFPLFEMGKSEAEKKAEKFKMSDIKYMFFLTLDQIKDKEKDVEKANILRDAKAYLNFLESKYKQMKKE